MLKTVGRAPDERWTSARLACLTPLKENLYLPVMDWPRDLPEPKRDRASRYPSDNGLSSKIGCSNASG